MALDLVRGLPLYLLRAMLLSAALVTAIGSVGCVGPTPEIDLNRSFASAIGDSAAITFRTEGDAPDIGGSGTGLLGLSDAVKRAIQNDPSLQAAIARVKIAQSDAQQARLLPNPVLSVVFRFPEGGGSPTIEAGLVAEIVGLISRPGQVTATDNRLRAAAVSAMTAVLDVMAEVQQKYVAVQALETANVALNERLRILSRLLDLARARLRAGEGSRLDVITLEAQQVELEAEIADQGLDLREQRLALARLVGEPSGAAAWQVEQWQRLDSPSHAESRWIAMALDHRPEVQGQRYELAALGGELSVARLAALGAADVGVDAERDGGSWSAGPSLNIPVPLFDMGQARRNRARAALFEGRHNLTRLQRQVIEETRTAYAALVATTDNLSRIQYRLIPLSQQRLEQAEAQFKAGQIDVTGLLLAEQDLRAAQVRVIELQRRNAEAFIRLQRAVGGTGQPSLAATQPSTQQTR